MYSAIKRGAAAWAIAGVLLFAWSGTVATTNRGERARAEDDKAIAERMDHFYRVVAGEDAGGPTPGDKLARDLRDLNPAFILSFKGDSNKYGGITDDLGFDPFQEGDDCEECGYLDRDIADNVAAIKQGRLARVLVDTRESAKPANERPGPPAFAWALWLISLPVYGIVLHVRHRKAEAQRYKDVAFEHNLVGELRKAQRELPPGSDEEWNNLESLANELQAQMEKRLSYRKSKTQAMRLEYLTKEATDALDAIEAGNKSLN